MTETESKWMKPTLREEALVEQGLARAEFRKLAGLVENICLSKPLPEARVRERDETRRLLDQLGVRGLRAALELTVSEDRFTPIPDERALTATSPLKWYDLFSLERDDEVIEWAERFGTQLLEESYAVLGPDADAQAERFQQATTAEEQVAVMEWLSTRLGAIAKDAEADDIDTTGMTDDEVMSLGLMYHPIRLSPKAIGNYPDIRIPPTCLGVSIINASFLHRCGADMMHAGVMASAHQQDLEEVIMVQGRAIEEIEKYAGRTDITEALMKKVYALHQNLLYDRGYHAAVYTKLCDGTWYQLDPNYQSSTRIKYEPVVERLDAVYGSLHDFRSSAPGLEIATLLPEGSLSNGVRTKYFGDNLDLTPEWRRRATEVLTDDNDEAWVQRVYEFAIERLLAVQTDSEYAEAMAINIEAAADILMFDDDLERANIKSQENYVADVLYGMIEDYLVGGESIDALRERCRHDTSYLARKVDDLWAMTHLAHVTATSGGYDVLDLGGTHYAVELGLPAARIGMAVLSDFALYMRASLPASFWLTEWSSTIPVTMADPQQESVPSQRLLHNTVGWIRNKDLYYFADYDKIAETTASLLNVEAPEEVEQDGGSSETR